MHPTRPSRALVSLLCLALAMPPAALAQSGTPVAGGPGPNGNLANPAGATGPLAASKLRASQENGGGDVPGNVAEGVFGVYGGAESRFANRPGTMSGLRAPLSSVQLPDLGDGSGGSLTPQAERKIGERMMREVRADPDYLDDWLLRDYLDSISSKLSVAAATQYLGGYCPDFDLFAVRDPQINAFSMPGGFIGVNTGLIAATQTESELASVVGHEMGHVLQRHIARDARHAAKEQLRRACRPARGFARVQRRSRHGHRDGRTGVCRRQSIALFARGRARGGPRRLPDAERRRL